jgi:hypothetical protein
VATKQARARRSSGTKHGARVSLLAAALVGCSSSTVSVDTVHVGYGLETSPFAVGSGVTKIELRTRDLAGAEAVVATAKPEDLTLTVPDAARTGTGALVLAGVDDAGNELAYGRTPPIDRTGLDSYIPTLFVQKGGVARALTLPTTGTTPAPTSGIRGATLGVRYAALGDASTRDLILFDLLSQKAAITASALDASPSLTLMSAGAFLLAIATNGATSSLDFDNQVRAQPSLPSGLATADVAGGKVLYGDDGAAYLVGATRAASAGGATDRVLRFASDGTLSARTLTTKRAGAIAVWIDGRGLVVIGGASDAAAPGAELLASSAATAVTLPFAADPTSGASGALVEAQVVLRARPDGALDRLDLACATSCAPTAATGKLGGATLDAAPLERGGVVFLGADGSLTRVDARGTVVAPLGTAAGATSLLPLSTGVVAVLGATDGLLRTVR